MGASRRSQHAKINLKTPVDLVEESLTNPAILPTFNLGNSDVAIVGGHEIINRSHNTSTYSLLGIILFLPFSETATETSSAT